MQSFLTAISLLPDDLKSALSSLPEDICRRVNEIRFRVFSPVTLCAGKDVFYITGSGASSYSDGALMTDEKKMQEIVVSLSRRSLHTYQDMIAKGFIPLRGGCKAGVAGCAVMKDGFVYSVSSFNCVNIRVSREYYGCADELLRAVDGELSYLIIGQPLSGKTTLLRDICRSYSGRDSKRKLKTAVVDERDEIASSSFGKGADLGIHTDILSLYPKDIGTQIALRTLSPDVIIVDEIGTKEEAEALLSCFNSGVGVVATAHGSSFVEVMRRPNISMLVESGVFRKAVVLEGKEAPCRIREVITL